MTDPAGSRLKSRCVPAYILHPRQVAFSARLRIEKVEDIRIKLQMYRSRLFRVAYLCLRPEIGSEILSVRSLRVVKEALFLHSADVRQRSTLHIVFGHGDLLSMLSPDAFFRRARYGRRRGILRRQAQTI
ncbi:hypothetical protein ASC97_03055 [Rhizobium sp. Root1203]|nr:hypothetical protein ASC97_03055 [Rhizobium sp. Root1203]